MVWRRQGALGGTLIVKASYSVSPQGDLQPVAADPVRRQEQCYGGDSHRAVQLPSDTAPWIERAEVLFIKPKP